MFNFIQNMYSRYRIKLLKVYITTDFQWDSGVTKHCKCTSIDMDAHKIRGS